MILEKLPVAEPSIVKLLTIVGFWLVLQHTPLVVTVAPPSDVTFPPLVAVIWAMLVAEVVKMVGLLIL